MTRSRNHTGDNIERSEYYGAMQRIIDTLFYDGSQDEYLMALRKGSQGEQQSTTSMPSQYESACTAAQHFGVSDRTAAVLGLTALVPDASTNVSNKRAFLTDISAERMSSGVTPADTSVATASIQDAIPEGDVIVVRRLDVVIAAENSDLPDDLMRIVNLLPPGEYTRQKLCDQINSAITGHAWGQVYGTVS